MGFPGEIDNKESAIMQETWIQSWVRESPGEREWLSMPVFWPGAFTWPREEPGGLHSPMNVAKETKPDSFTFSPNNDNNNNNKIKKKDL